MRFLILLRILWTALWLRQDWGGLAEHTGNLRRLPRTKVSVDVLFVSVYAGARVSSRPHVPVGKRHEGILLEQELLHQDKNEIVLHPTKTDTSPCGGTLVAASGFIATPNYPLNYTNNLKCHWTIKGPPHSMINLTSSLHTFATESQYDQLDIYSEDPNISQTRRVKNMTLLRSLSGRLSENVISFGLTSIMHLRFSTDKSDTDTGFQLHYTIIMQNISKVDVWETAGTLQSTGYPTDYAINQRLTWTIHGSDRGTQIRVMDMELDRTAEDHIVIARGNNLRDGIVSTLLGNLGDIGSAHITITNSSTFVVHFSSHFHNTPRRGWILSYKPCHEVTETINYRQSEIGAMLYTELARTELINCPSLLYVPSPPLSADTTEPAQRKDTRRLSNYRQTDSVNSEEMAYLAEYSASSYALRGAGTYSTVPLMEIDVEPFHPLQDWQRDLKECLCSMIPRNIFRQQRRPTITTTVLHWGEGDVVRVMITTSEGTDDFVHQLRNALSTGKVRCNDTLEMYLPDLIRDVQSKMTGQNWLLASICIIAFFVITFSALLFLHCKQRRIIVRKKKVPTSQISTLPCQAMMKQLNVVMEPAVQRNPIYEVGRPVMRDKDSTRTKSSLKKCQLASRDDDDDDSAEDDGFNYPAPLPGTIRMYPQVSRAKNMAGTTIISQTIPSLTEGSLTQGYNRNLDIILEPKDEETVSVKSTSATSDHSDDCQLEADMGEILEVSCEALTPESYATMVDEWRNGRPMTVRAVKQKNQLKKQLKRDVFDKPSQVEVLENDPSPV